MMRSAHRGSRDRGGPGPVSVGDRRTGGALLACCILATALPASGCGGSRETPAPVPIHVPPGAVAVVGAVPITTASFRHWLAIALRHLGPAGGRGNRHRSAVEQTLSFLVKAQWLQQEATAEGVDERALTRLVSRRTAGTTPQSGITHADAALQARLDIIADALRERHRKAGAVTPGQVASYYARHRAKFRSPAVRETLMIVTASRSEAIAAKAALARGQSWASVARRYSEDSSALAGAAYAIVQGVQPPRLWRAASKARRHQLVGPIEAPQVAGPPASSFYLFEVVGGRPGTQLPLTAVATELGATLAERGRERAYTAFTSAYEQRWRYRTLCAPGYLTPLCRNGGGFGERDPETAASSFGQPSNTFE
jgi:PPIC-type PPIASE domain